MLNSYESARFPYKTFSVPISKFMNRLTANPAPSCNTVCTTIVLDHVPHIYLYTSHVLCNHSNGERASLANLELRLFVGMLLVWQKLS